MTWVRPCLVALSVADEQDREVCHGSSEIAGQSAGAPRDGEPRQSEARIFGCHARYRHLGRLPIPTNLAHSTGEISELFLVDDRLEKSIALTGYQGNRIK